MAGEVVLFPDGLRWMVIPSDPVTEHPPVVTGPDSCPTCMFLLPSIPPEALPHRHDNRGVMT